jgi:hypothetical protein
MKTRIIIFIGISAIATLSFSFASSTKQNTNKVTPIENKSKTEPIGGFLSEDKF